MITKAEVGIQSSALRKGIRTLTFRNQRSHSVTAWIAFSDSTEASGCMRFIPGSHKGPHILPHVETRAPDNLLSRGQTIENIDESKARFLPARAGEFSIHHNKPIHSSEPNLSDDARIGFTVHFATPEIRQAQFDGATDFGGGPLPDSGDQDVVVARYTQDGTHLWSRAFGGMENAFGSAVAGAPDDGIVAVGDYNGTIDFDGTLFTAGGRSGFVVKLSP